MATSVVEKSCKKKTEKKLAAREEAKLLAGFMGVMNSMRKQVPPGWEGRAAGPQRVAGSGLRPLASWAEMRALRIQTLFFLPAMFTSASCC